MSNYAIILAAGKGTRMKSDLPKVLHKVAGISMLEHVFRAVSEIKPAKIETIVGHKAELVEQVLAGRSDFALQSEQLGTGHAVMMAEPALAGLEGHTLVIAGDTPLITGESLKNLVNFHVSHKNVATILTAQADNPFGYGRIIRNADGEVVKIVEQKDANDFEKQVKEINTGTYLFENKRLFEALKEINTDNAQGEYYLTDIIGMLVSAGKVVSAFAAPSYAETLGVNSRQQMAEAERVLRQRKLDELMTDGVSIIDPNNTYVDTTVTVGRDTVLYPGTILEGDTIIGEGCQVGPYVRMTNVKMGDDDHVQFMYAHDCEIKNGCEIGPFVHFRPNTVIGNQVKVGNYMEVKNSTVGDGTKLPHLSYIGDSDVGSGVNIGCGTITVNYDGKIKHRTTIGDHAFVGCNSNLVAPVKVGDYAYVGAGSTITKDIPAKALSVARARQRNIEGWVKEDTYKK